MNAVIRMDDGRGFRAEIDVKTEKILSMEPIQKGARTNKEKRADVIAWRKAHPDGRKIDCFRDTGVTRPTIDKWWNEGA